MLRNDIDNRIYGELKVPCKAPGKKSPVVIFSHTFGGNRTDNKTIQRILVAAGIAVYSFDFVGGSGFKPGCSIGSMREMSIFTEKENLDAVIDMMQRHEDIDPEQIYLFGASQGGLVSALVASSRQEEIKGLFLVYPAFSIPDDARKLYSDESEIPEHTEVLGLTVGKNYYQYLLDYDAFEAIEGYKGKVWIFTGDDDKIVDPTYSVKAHRVYENARLKVFEGEGHGFTRPTQRKVAKTIIEEMRNMQS